MKLNLNGPLIAAGIIGLATIVGTLILDLNHIATGSFVTEAGSVLTIIVGLFGISSQNGDITARVNGNLGKLIDSLAKNPATPPETLEVVKDVSDATGVTPTEPPTETEPKS